MLERCLVCLFLSLALAACTIGGETVINQHAAIAGSDAGMSTSKDPTTPAKSKGSACAGNKLAAVDTKKLTPCEKHGHCYAKAKLPGDLTEVFGPCDDADERCVPDEILTAGGKKLKACTQPDSVKSVTGEGGGCVTLALMPEVEKRAGAFLEQRECAPDQVCMPCKNPEGNTATPFCEEIGVFEAECKEDGVEPAESKPEAGPSATPCCSANGTSNGVCMSSSVLPEGKRDSMPQDVCAETDVCMPSSMMQGKGVACEAGLIFGRGVCMDRCFNTMLKIAGALGALGRDVCGETELCTPCSVLEDQMPAGVPVPGCK